MRDRRLVQLFDYPQGWQEGTVMRRCVRKGKPSNVYDIKYADGFTMTHECDPDEYGATNGKKWCIIQPIERDVEGSDVMRIEYLKCLERRCEGKHRKGLVL